MTPGKTLKRLRGMCFLTFSTTFVNLILRTDNFQLRRIYVNKNRSCKYKRIAINIYKINKLKGKVVS